MSPALFAFSEEFVSVVVANKLKACLTQFGSFSRALSAQMDRGWQKEGRLTSLAPIEKSGTTGNTRKKGNCGNISTNLECKSCRRERKVFSECSI